MNLESISKQVSYIFIFLNDLFLLRYSSNSRKKSINEMWTLLTLFIPSGEKKEKCGHFAAGFERESLCMMM